MNVPLAYLQRIFSKSKSPRKYIWRQQLCQWNEKNANWRQRLILPTSVRVWTLSNISLQAHCQKFWKLIIRKSFLWSKTPFSFSLHERFFAVILWNFHAWKPKNQHFARKCHFESRFSIVYTKFFVQKILETSNTIPYFLVFSISIIFSSKTTQKNSYSPFYSHDVCMYSGLQDLLQFSKYSYSSRDDYNSVVFTIMPALNYRCSWSRNTSIASEFFVRVGRFLTANTLDYKWISYCKRCFHSSSDRQWSVTCAIFVRNSEIFVKKSAWIKPRKRHRMGDRAHTILYSSDRFTREIKKSGRSEFTFFSEFEFILMYG